MPVSAPRLVSSLNVNPSQAPSQRVDSRVKPMHLTSPRVDPTIPHHSVIPLTPYPAALNAPYVPQGMAGENIFDTFKEEHTETPPLPQYNTRATEQQYSAHIVQHNAQRVSRPITLTNIQDYHIVPHHSINQVPISNAVINQDTGASLEYRQLMQDYATLPIWNKSAAH
jgi:hypothetical protein